MKKKIILGLLAGVLLLFFVISSWALDYKRYKYDGRPEQECMRVPVNPQTIDTYPSMIRFIFISAGQNLPVLIYIEKFSTQVPIKIGDSIKNSTSTVNEIDKIK